MRWKKGIAAVALAVSGILVCWACVHTGGDTKAMFVEITPSMAEEIALRVRAAAYEESELIEWFSQEYFYPDELDPDAVRTVIRAEMARLATESASWPAVTDCDRLDAAFNAMRARGVIALQNAGYTQSDGFEDCCEVYRATPEKETV